MNDGASKETDLRTQTYIAGGIRLEIVVKKIAEDEWSLSVVNQQRIQSTWWEFFESPDAAFAVARRAIQEEGVEEFENIKGFEYLDELEKDV